MSLCEVSLFKLVVLVSLVNHVIVLETLYLVPSEYLNETYLKIQCRSYSACKLNNVFTKLISVCGLTCTTAVYVKLDVSL